MDKNGSSSVVRGRNRAIEGEMDRKRDERSKLHGKGKEKGRGKAESSLGRLTTAEVEKAVHRFYWLSDTHAQNEFILVEREGLIRVLRRSAVGIK